MKRSVLFITFFFVICHYGAETEADGMHEGVVDADTYRNVTEIIESKGYPVVQHTVQTADGYLLSVQRIPHGRNNFYEQGKEVVLLIHGIANDATTWVLNFPGQSLGFVLPDEGYDVWLINTRGSYYSKRHVKYKTDQYQFWNFSFSEVGEYDIPATIDYILDATGKEAIHIIGYSQGSMSSFAMLSEMPDYNHKVKLLVALAPVAFIGHTTSVIRLAVPFRNEILFFSKLFTHGELDPENRMIKIFLGYFCSTNVVEFCENVLFAIGGVDRKQLNETRIDVYTSQFLSTTSTKSLVHLLQLVHSKRFRKYDYGRRRNLKYYQQEEPPDYETSRITAPVALISSSNDIIADPTDVDMLRQTLPQTTLVFDYQVPYPYNHFDYVLAENAPTLINGPVLQLLAKY